MRESKLNEGVVGENKRSYWLMGSSKRRDGVKGERKLTPCIFVHVTVYVCMCRHVYVYLYDCFAKGHTCTYCICMYVMTMYSAVRIPLVSNCAI